MELEFDEVPEILVYEMTRINEISVPFDLEF